MIEQPALQQLSDGARRCIEACLEGHVSSLATARYALERGGAQAAPKHIRLLLDTASTCHLCVSLFHSTGAERQAFHLCAAYSERCADDCERLGRWH